MSTCCHAAGDRKTRATRLQRVREICAGALPSLLLVFVPKCPACLAAYVTLWTGIGLSLSTAAYLRWSLLFVCAASLTFLIGQRLHRIVTCFRDFKKGTAQCNIK